MLINDLERLRNGLLIWQLKIVKAFNNSHPSKVTYQELPKVIEKYLTEEEMKLIKPAIQIIKTVLN